MQVLETKWLRFHHSLSHSRPYIKAGWKTFSDPSHFSDPSQNFLYCSILLKTFSEEKPSQILLKDASQISRTWKSFLEASQSNILCFQNISIWYSYLESIECILKWCLSQILIIYNYSPFTNLLKIAFLLVSDKAKH